MLRNVLVVLTAVALLVCSFTSFSLASRISEHDAIVYQGHLRADHRHDVVADLPAGGEETSAPHAHVYGLLLPDDVFASILLPNLRPRIEAFFGGQDCLVRLERPPKLTVC